MDADNQEWEAKMHSYLKNVCWDVTKDTDPVVFWSAAWGNNIVDLAQQNAEEIEVVDENEDTLKAYQTLLKKDVNLEAFKKGLDNLSD
ncbi:hypothetical protein C0995_010804 [Termitomyces sp. Mi166|nr:hypothetical protein C0995_010804 [Termitomyces sp. Mi166\